jgi:hypothetical protein
MASTYAEQTAATGERDDLHMIYEMGPTSQYEDKSVLICTTMTTYRREEAAAGIDALPFGGSGKKISKAGWPPFTLTSLALPSLETRASTFAVTRKFTVRANAGYCGVTWMTTFRLF